MKLIDRQDEMAKLHALAMSNRKEMLVLYGRRRMGKTTLLRAFAERHKALFFACPMATETEALRMFQNSLATVFAEPLLSQTAFPGWHEALTFAFERAAREKVSLILDEFPYLLKSVPGVDSIMQHLWDAQREKIVLMLSGSLLSIMQNDVIGRNAPLYGRRTEQMDLHAMDFEGISGFYPGGSLAERVRWYAFWGGVPAYAERASAVGDPDESVQELVLDPSGVFYDEPEILVREELREPAVYFSILHSLAVGQTRPNEIAQDAGIPHSGVSKYLETLCKMRLVKREVPITEKNPHRSTKGIYRLADHFVRFWFRYVYPNRGLIEMGKGKRLYSARIRPDLDVFLGAVYEEICRQVIARDGQKWLGFEPFKVGRYWDAEREIDIIVENEDAGRATFVECKWGSRVHVDRELAELRKKAESLPHYTNVRKDYFVISRTPTKHPQHILFG